MDKLTLKFEKYIETDHPVLGDYWIVECPEIPGFVSDGKTIQEALAMAIDCYETITDSADDRWSLELAELLRAMQGDETYTKRLSKILGEKNESNGDG